MRQKNNNQKGRSGTQQLRLFGDSSEASPSLDIKGKFSQQPHGVAALLGKVDGLEAIPEKEQIANHLNLMKAAQKKHEKEKAKNNLKQLLEHLENLEKKKKEIREEEYPHATDMDELEFKERADAYLAKIQDGPNMDHLEKLARAEREDIYANRIKKGEESIRITLGFLDSRLKKEKAGTDTKPEEECLTF